MNENILLSVIIPCYNCENYIYDCIQSVYHQIDDSVEVIIVNDGSTDDSLNVINSFIQSATNNSLKVISQKNSGISATRNTGIKLAKGSYIALLDGDDLWDDNFWKTIKPLIEKHAVDLVEFNANRFFDGDKNKKSLVSVVDENMLTEVNTLQDLSHIFKKNEWFPWARVYKRELFDSISFPVGMHYEDIATISLVYLLAKNIVSIKDELVFYRIRKNSITNTFIPSDIDDLIQVLRILNNIKLQNEPDGLTVIKPSMIMTFKLAKRISTHIHGYCYFNPQQTEQIKKLMRPYIKNEKFSFYIKTLLLREYCLINNIKYKFRNKRALQ